MSIVIYGEIITFLKCIIIIIIIIITCIVDNYLFKIIDKNIAPGKHLYDNPVCLPSETQAASVYAVHLTIII